MVEKGYDLNRTDPTLSDC